MLRMCLCLWDVLAQNVLPGCQHEEGGTWRLARSQRSQRAAARGSLQSPCFHAVTRIAGFHTTSPSPLTACLGASWPIPGCVTLASVGSQWRLSGRLSTSCRALLW